MAPYSDDDPYLDEASGVLKNKLGITEQDELEQAEAALVATRSYQIQQTPLKGDFDLKHRQAIHKHLFGDVYEWAGELRTIDISKGGNMFAHHGHIRAPPRRSSGSLRKSSAWPGWTQPRSAAAPRTTWAN